MTKSDNPKPSGALPEPVNSIWNGLNSLPIAIIVMILLALLSALGTMIPQEHMARPAPGQTLDQMYVERFGPDISTPVKIPGTNLQWNIPKSKLALIKSLGLTRIYFTPYFFILLVWLSVSAIVCNITRFKRTYGLWKSPRVSRGQEFFRGDKRAIVTGGADSGQRDSIFNDLKSRGYRIFKTDNDDGTVSIYADRGFLKRWALVLLHFSILVLLFGGIYGKIYGVESYIRMGDGEKKPLTLDLKENKIRLVHWLIDQVPELTYNLDQTRFRIDYDQKIALPAMLQEMFDEGRIPAEVEPYYRYFVKDFVSELTVEHNGKSKTQEVKVNHPIMLDKLVLYQSGYQQIGYIAVSIDGETKDYQAPPDMPLVVGPGGLSRMNPGMGGDSSNTAFMIEQVKAGDLYVGGENTGPMGPLTIAHLFDMTTGQSLGQKLLTPDQGFETEIGGKTATVRMSQRVDNYSDFSYKRDPGIPILYFGWIAMIVGITLTLYLTFTQVWIRLDKDKTYCLVAGGSGAQAAARTLYSRWNDMLSTQ